jgi:betaine-aldehyde dehydrogenase
MDQAVAAKPTLVLPGRLDLYYGGGWHVPLAGGRRPTVNPGTGEVLAEVAEAAPEDMNAAIAAARAGFLVWRDVAPLERGRILREAAARIRAHGPELAMLDAADSGNPVTDMMGDSEAAAAQTEFFAGLVTEMKGASVPMGPDRLNVSVREPMGVVARILPFNHPLMFAAGKTAAILAAGNAVVVKPADQAPLSTLRLAELWGDLFPAGVFNVLPGGREAAAHLASHHDVDMTALVGSVPAGRAVMRAASDTLKPVLLELGGKNALIAFPDADPDEVAEAVVAGMNFAWCGQSCGSTSRAFLHASIHDAVVKKLKGAVARFKPGLPTDPATTMGAVVSREQRTRIFDFIEGARASGARLLCGGGSPKDPALERGFFVEPTIFTDVTQDMTLAREEVFGPVLAVLKWSGQDEMLEAVNGVDYGLTCSIWTNDLNAAHRTAARVEAGFVWINEVGRHFLGAPFGGYKQSGIGREECLDELLAYTREKNIHIRLKPGSGAR